MSHLKTKFEDFVNENIKLSPDTLEKVEEVVTEEVEETTEEVKESDEK